MNVKTYLLSTSQPGVVVQVSLSKAGVKFVLNEIKALARLRDGQDYTEIKRVSFRLATLRSKGITVTVMPVIQDWAESLPPEVLGTADMYGRMEIIQQRIQFCWVAPKKPNLTSGSITDTFLQRISW